jgi:hypothetical protein
MALKSLRGDRKKVNPLILSYAVKNKPALIIDCANCANVLAIAPYVNVDELDKVFVIELEMLYKFRDTLLETEKTAKNLGVSLIVVTTIGRMFNYNDEYENKMINFQIWEILRELGEEFEVLVGVEFGSVHDPLSIAYSDSLVSMEEIMGHTVDSQRRSVDYLLAELKEYGKALDKEDRIIYDKLLKLSLKHIGSISFASSVHVWAMVLLSTVLEQEKKFKKLESKYESLANRFIPEREEYRPLAKAK